MGLNIEELTALAERIDRQFDECEALDIPIHFPAYGHWRTWIDGHRCLAEACRAKAADPDYSEAMTLRKIGELLIDVGDGYIA